MLLEESEEEEGAAVMEEFYPDEFDSGSPRNSANVGNKPGLADKLNQKAAHRNAHAASAPVTLSTRSALNGTDELP